MTVALLIAAGYVVGSIPSGYWLVRAVKGTDIRTIGSGNIGGTNVWRAYGRWLGLPVILLDITKGFAAAFAATQIAGHLVGVLTGGAAMIGHFRPLFLGFARGGKIVATASGAFLGVAPAVGGIGVAVFLVVVLLVRYVSVGSIVSSGSTPLIAVLLDEPWPVITFACITAVSVVLLHRDNLGRLLAGKESRVILRQPPPVTDDQAPLAS